VPELLYALVHGKNRYHALDITMARNAVHNVTQSNIVARIHAELGPARIAEIEYIVDQDMQDIVDPPKGAFVPKEDIV